MFWNVLSRIAIVGCMSSLLACSSGSGGATGGDQLGGDDTVRITDPSVLPISGTARYDGLLTLGLPTENGRESFTGQLGLDVDFDAAAEQVTGEANRFLSPSNEELRGRILITDGELDRSTNVAEDYTFEAGMSGTLSGTQFRNVVISGTMLGDFNGPDAQILTGRTFGDVVNATGVDIFNGTFTTSVN